ncbi:unnamed protein product [Acanthosepion pharaonis]|uniref:Uncharacterized protein n=1 Tax=Acanthosepion pharaonis TaxID=158019 RepID=A0A812CR48_ACAPH|nr:unnamed protein product [Sepia pharaonis]
MFQLFSFTIFLLCLPNHISLPYSSFSSLSCPFCQLAKQEEELRMEEEAYYEARREAARIARLQRVAKEQAAKNFSKIGATGRSWLGDNENEWDVAGGEDDFEMFLASVKARSLSARTQLRQASADGQSTSSSTTHTRDRSHTEASSLDLEWDHEAGIVPQKAPRSATEENLVALAAQEILQVSPVNSNDLEWDNDYAPSLVLPSLFLSFPSFLLISFLPPLLSPPHALFSFSFFFKWWQDDCQNSFARSFNWDDISSVASNWLPSSSFGIGCPTFIFTACIFLELRLFLSLSLSLSVSCDICLAIHKDMDQSS